MFESTATCATLATVRTAQNAHNSIANLTGAHDLYDAIYPVSGDVLAKATIRPAVSIWR